LRDEVADLRAQYSEIHEDAQQSELVDLTYLVQSDHNANDTSATKAVYAKSPRLTQLGLELERLSAVLQELKTSFTDGMEADLTTSFADHRFTFLVALNSLNSLEPELHARRDALADPEISRIATEKRRNRRRIRFLRRETCCSIAVFELIDLEGQLALEKHRKSQRQMAMEQLEVAVSNGKSARTKMQSRRMDRAGFRRKKLGLGRLRRRTSCFP
jgi:hypothetical protein